VFGREMRGTVNVRVYACGIERIEDITASGYLCLSLSLSLSLDYSIYLQASTNSSRIPFKKLARSLDSFSRSTTLSTSSCSTFGRISSTL
jgi:hypothetical protein